MGVILKLMGVIQKLRQIMNSDPIGLLLKKSLMGEKSCIFLVGLFTHLKEHYTGEDMNLY